MRIDVRGCPFRGLVPLNSTSLSSTMRFWGDCVSLCTVILHAYRGMYVAACWAYSKLDLVGGTIYLREREKGTGWIGRMAFTWLSDDLPLLLFQVYFVIQYASNRAPLVHTQIRGTTTGLAEKRPNRRAEFAVGVVSRKREGRLWCRGRASHLALCVGFMTPSVLSCLTLCMSVRLFFTDNGRG